MQELRFLFQPLYLTIQPVQLAFQGGQPFTRRVLQRWATATSDIVREGSAEMRVEHDRNQRNHQSQNDNEPTHVRKVSLAYHARPCRRVAIEREIDVLRNRVQNGRTITRIVGRDPDHALLWLALRIEIGACPA